MRELVKNYLKKADPKLLAAMTSEERRYVARVEKATKADKGGK